jgi:hypothetical protein
VHCTPAAERSTCRFGKMNVSQETERCGRLDLQHSRRPGDRLRCCIFARNFRRGRRITGGGARAVMCARLPVHRLKTRFSALRQVKVAAAKLRAARPTAVNLMWAIDRMLGDGKDLGAPRCDRRCHWILREGAAHGCTSDPMLSVPFFAGSWSARCRSPTRT